MDGARRGGGRETLVRFSLFIFFLIFSMLIVVFRPCAQNPVLPHPGNGNWQTANGHGNMRGNQVRRKRARAPAARPIALRLPSPLPRPDCNRVNIEPGRHMRERMSTALSPLFRRARPAPDTWPDSRVLRPSELKVDSRRARSHTQTHRVTAQDRVREARQPGACADKS